MEFSHLWAGKKGDEDALREGPPRRQEGESTGAVGKSNPGLIRPGRDSWAAVRQAKKKKEAGTTSRKRRTTSTSPTQALRSPEPEHGESTLTTIRREKGFLGSGNSTRGAAKGYGERERAFLLRSGENEGFFPCGKVKERHYPAHRRCGLHIIGEISFTSSRKESPRPSVTFSVEALTMKHIPL